MVEKPTRQDIPKDLNAQLGAGNIINPLSTGSAPSSQELPVIPTLESEAAATPVTVPEEQPLYGLADTDADNLLSEGDGGESPIVVTEAETDADRSCQFGLPYAILQARRGQEPN